MLIFLESSDRSGKIDVSLSTRIFKKQRLTRMNLSLGSRLQLLRGPNSQPNYHSLQAHQTTTPSWAAVPRSPNTTTGSAQTTSEQALPLVACAAAADDDEVTTTTSPVRKLGMAERQVAQLGPGAACCGWNHCGRRLAAGAIDGFVSVYDSQPSPSSKWQAHQHSIANVVWLPPEYGDAIACVSADGTLSLWEEVAEDGQLPTWRKCKVFEGGNSHILNVQFGLLLSSLKMVTAYSDGQVKVYELLDSLELDKWQLQAEFQNITDPVSRFGKPACISASIAWSPRRSESQQASFAIGFNSDSPNFNSCKIWEFEEAHQRWLPLVDLSSPEDKGDRVYAVAWAPNIGRPYEIIAVATCKGIAIWHISLNLESDGGLSTENVAVLSGHDGEVWQLEWDMGGMTLASAGGDGMVKLWQANLNGVWHEQSVLDCSGLHD